MRSRSFHILSSLFLVANLLFAQVAVNFFHRNHDVHENKSITVPLGAGESGVQKHDEHCRVCSIDFFNHAFIAESILIFASTEFELTESSICFFVQQSLIDFAQGRAPPFIA